MLAMLFRILKHETQTPCKLSIGLTQQKLFLLSDIRIYFRQNNLLQLLHV